MGVFFFAENIVKGIQLLFIYMHICSNAFRKLHGQNLKIDKKKKTIQNYCVCLIVIAVFHAAARFLPSSLAESKHRDPCSTSACRAREEISVQDDTGT